MSLPEAIAEVLGGSKVHRPTGEPGPAQSFEGIASGDLGADPGWVTEHLVKRDANEFGSHAAQAQWAAWNESSGIQNHLETKTLRLTYQSQIVLNSREIRLSRKGEQVGGVRVPFQQVVARTPLNTQMGIQRQVTDLGLCP